MRNRWLLLAATVVVGCLGCQSGMVAADMCFSSGRDVIAFRDDVYDDVYVADANGVAAVGRGAFVLRPDGRWLFVIEAPRGRDDADPAFPAGRRITLYDVTARRGYEAVLPRDVPAACVRDPRPMFGPEGSLKGQAFVERYPQQLMVYLLDGPELVIGPFPEGVSASEPCLGWRPGADWRPLARPPGDMAQLFPAKYYGEFAHYFDTHNVVRLEPTCDAPRRTVWVRPDGSTLELLRQNDATAKFVSFLLHPGEWFFVLIGMGNGWVAPQWAAFEGVFQKTSGEWPESVLEERAAFARQHREALLKIEQLRQRATQPARSSRNADRGEPP